MRFLLYIPVLLSILVLVSSVDPAQARENGFPATDGSRDGLGVLVLDGSGVHDIGELLLHTGNWGIFGSYPGTSIPVSVYPSAEWPAGSGVEHLFIEGIWVGAVKDGLPRVSTSAFDMEFLPSDDPVDIIYHSFEGAPGGTRLPSAGADDDGDGAIDEDFLDGRDNDGDGLVDEDFAAISPQMFSSWYMDDKPGITDIYPQHEPLDIIVRQETYEWNDERFDDFVGAKFTVTNVGEDILEDVYFGLLVDPDIGRRTDGAYWQDDACGYWSGTVETELGSSEVSIAYAYDAMGEIGGTTSYFGAMILGNPVDLRGVTAPAEAGINSFQVFVGDLPFEEGGDPTSDSQRYELMASRSFDGNNTGPVDCRFLVSTGPFAGLGPGESIVFHVAMVAGDGLAGLVENAARCKRFFDGVWFEHDGEMMQAHWMLERPPVAGTLDIKPGTCKNPFNTRNFEFARGGNPRRGGVMPVAILGGEGFDVTKIDISTVRLNGVAPLERGRSFGDVSGPGDGDGDCDCPSEGPDGYTDLLLKFGNGELAATRLVTSLPVPGEKWLLTMTGEFDDGTPFEMSDCVTFVGPPPESARPRRPMLLTGETRLIGASPNPFNPSTTVSFELASPVEVSIAVYDAGGRLVRRLVEERLTAGVHEVTWNGFDENGTTVSSGVYFCRLVADGARWTRKIVLLR